MSTPPHSIRPLVRWQRVFRLAFVLHAVHVGWMVFRSTDPTPMLLVISCVYAALVSPPVILGLIEASDRGGRLGLAARIDKLRVPNRAYWLAPARRVATTLRARRFFLGSLWSLVVALAVHVHGLALTALGVSNGAFGWVLWAYAAICAAGLCAFVWPMWRIPDEDSA